MTTPNVPSHTKDPDEHKGAIEGDRPGDEQQGNENGPGVDAQGMPNDPTASAEDKAGADADKSTG
jgi:hypothetical protein